MANKSIFKWNPEDYQTTERIRATHSRKEIAAEYSRLRDIAHKRLQRLGQSEFASGDLYREYKDAFPYVKDTPAAKLPAKLLELQYFLNLRTSTVSGARKARRTTVRSLNERGYKFINDKNLKEFGQFMEHARDLKISKIYDSDRVAQLYDWAQEHRVNAEDLEKDFNFWLKHQPELEDLEEPPEEWTGKKKLTDIRKQLRKNGKRK